jgi:GMP synthase (glutamine-hydrolysing)
MQVLVVQHVAGEGSGAIGAALRERGIAERAVRLDRGESVPDALGAARALVLMGGPMGVYEADRFPHLRDEIRLIERAVSDGAPVLGVCLGSQLLAAALGARVVPGPRMEIGWREVRLRDRAQTDPLFTGCPQSFVPLHWHGDIFDLPGGAVLLASSEHTEHQAFRFGANAWGILFHLEMGTGEVAAMTDHFPDDLVRAAVPRAEVVGGAEERVRAVAPVANRVFGAWADLVRV